MMIGTIRWNLIAGASAFLLTFVMSMMNNIWQTTLLRSTYSFVILFVIMFLIRWMLGSLFGFRTLGQVREPRKEEASETETGKGQNFDMLTPDDDESLQQMLKETIRPNKSGAEGAPFERLNPPKLTTKLDMDTDEMVQALRRMSDD